MEDVLSGVESYIPEENRETVREYLLSVPGQKPEVKHKVFSSLKAAVRSYVAIRGSTGMSVRELLDYAIKSCGGTLPRASYAPPAIGYVTPGMRTSQDAGDRRIYIEEKVSSLAARLLEVAVPEKEVPFEQLIKPRRDLSGAEENKPVVAIGNMNERKDFEPVYDTRAEADISDAVLLILRNLYVPKSGGKDSTRKLPELKKELLEIAEKNGSREDFIKAVSERFSIRYDIQDEAAREEVLEEHRTDPVIDYRIGNRIYKLKKSQIAAIERNVESELDNWVESQEKSMSPQEYYDLLLRYEKYTEEKLWRK